MFVISTSSNCIFIVISIFIYNHSNWNLDIYYTFVAIYNVTLLSDAGLWKKSQSCQFWLITYPCQFGHEYVDRVCCRSNVVYSGNSWAEILMLAALVSCCYLCDISLYLWKRDCAITLKVRCVGLSHFLTGHLQYIWVGYGRLRICDKPYAPYFQCNWP